MTYHLTQVPGTLAFVPPEVMVAKPRYDTSVDIFSYGNIMVHIFSGRWPEVEISRPFPSSSSLSLCAPISTH